MPQVTPSRRPAMRVLPAVAAVAIAALMSASSASAFTLPAMPDELSLVRLLVEMLEEPANETSGDEIRTSGAVRGGEQKGDESSELSPATVEEGDPPSMTGGTGDDPAGPWPGQS